MDLELKNKTILITGGSSGIGRAMALEYAKEEGVHIAITYYQNKEGADDTVKQINTAGGDALAVYMGLGDHSSIEVAIKTVIEKWGSIDVLINNAVQWGSRENLGKGFEEIPLSVWEQMISVNLFGTVKVTQLAIPYMRAANWGRIINVSSDLAFDSMKGSGSYSTLKASLVGFTANLVEEYSQYNVLTNTVLPSWTLTERAMKYFPEEYRKEVQVAYPTGRITTPEDVAKLIVYLGSGANGHVNGETVRVTGKATISLVNHIFRKYRDKR